MPPCFYVELLLPEKQGDGLMPTRGRQPLTPLLLGGSGSYSFGLHICPIKDDVTSISVCSSAYHVGYDVWREWEDCLSLQESLEVEYSRMAREKRNHLAAGKGVKKKGVYHHGDHAASFESPSWS